MKNLAYISAFSLCIFILSACNKNEPGDPRESEPLLTRPDTIRFTGANNFTYAKFFIYDNNGKYLGLGGLSYGIFYSYNSEDRVSSVKSIGINNGSNQPVVTTTVHYQNGLPISGSLKNYAVDYKDINPQYWTDSIQYTVLNNQVVRIRYFDRRHYADKTHQLLRLEPGTTDTYTVSYERNNLSKLVRGSTVLWDATYGTKKGYFAAHKMKFFLFYGEDPELHSENDLTSATQPSSISAWQKSTYSYQYNLAGYPKSAELNVVQSDGRNSYLQNVKYRYK